MAKIGYFCLKTFDLDKRKHIAHIVLTVTLFVIVLLMTGCLSKFIYSSKELAEHFAEKKYSIKYNLEIIEKQPIFIAETGDSTKPVLLLIHGAPGAWYGYLNLMDDSILRKNFHIISIDRPGYGQSNYGKNLISPKRQAELFLQIVEKYTVNKQPATILGRSYGSPIAIWMAAINTKAIKKIVLVSSVLDPDKEKFYWFSPIGKWKVVQFFLPKMLNVATEEKYAHAEEMKKLFPFISKVKCDSYILQGCKDWIADTSNFSYAQKTLVNSKQECYCLKDNSHLITYERPELVREVLLK